MIFTSQMSAKINDQALLSDSENDLLPLNTSENSKTYSLLFFLLGNSSLLGFNIIINAIDIYIKLTGNGNIGTILNRFYNFPCSITSLLLCVFKPKQYKYLLITSLTMLILLLCGMPMALLISMSDKSNDTFHSQYPGCIFLI